MPTLERKLTIRRDLAQRANRKLRRYGRTLDDAINGALMFVVSSRGLPDFVEREPGSETRGDPLESLDLEFGSADEAIAYLHDYVQNRP